MYLPDLVVDVRPNPDAEATVDPGDDFVRWPVVVEVEAEQEGPTEIVDTVARILTAMWGAGIPAVAACDFEDELPWAGGIRRLPDPSGS